jgi:mRNA-degrading endonuclease RelE of RelBE toxin-antitoxin system
MKKPLGMKDLYRVDVHGDYRIIYSVNDRTKTVTVEKVGDRKEIYRFLKR